MKPSISDRLFLYLLVTFIFVAVMVLESCMSIGPSDWRPDQHVLMMKECKVLCHPAAVKAYDPIDGECSCSHPQLMQGVQQ